jgi:hypothetical protein
MPPPPAALHNQTAGWVRRTDAAKLHPPARAPAAAAVGEEREKGGWEAAGYQWATVGGARLAAQVSLWAVRRAGNEEGRLYGRREHRDTIPMTLQKRRWPKVNFATFEVGL